MLRTDYEGMTLDLNGVKDDLNCSEFHRDADYVMENLVDFLNDLVVEYDIEMQELAEGYYMIENEDELHKAECELEGVLDQLLDEIGYYD